MVIICTLHPSYLFILKLEVCTFGPSSSNSPILSSILIFWNGAISLFFNGWIIFHYIYLPIYLSISISTYHKFFIHSSINGYLCFFHILANINNTTMNEQAGAALTQGLSEFPVGSDAKESACNAGKPGLIPWSGKAPEEGNVYPLQYSCLENLMDRWAWWGTFHGVTKRRTQLSD